MSFMIIGFAWGVASRRLYPNDPLMAVICMLCGTIVIGLVCKAIGLD